MKLKKCMRIIFTLVLLLGLFGLINANPASAALDDGFNHKAGDILYTKTTQCKDNKDVCKGITGHVGIVLSNGKVGHKNCPSNC